MHRKVLREHGFVVTLGEGALDDRTLREHVLALNDEAAGLASLDELAHVAGVTDLERLSGDGIREAARLEASRSPALRGRLAIVVGSPLQFGLARIYRAVVEPYRAEVQLFEDLTSAIHWLGADAIAPQIRAELDALRDAAGGAPPEVASP